MTIITQRALLIPSDEEEHLKSLLSFHKVPLRDTHPADAGEIPYRMGRFHEWTTDLHRLLVASEEAEYSLSYLSSSDTEKIRRQSGSYYTPKDVSLFFWREFFNRNAIKDATSATVFLRSHQFIEPSVGAGALVFSLFYSLAMMGVSPAELAEINLLLVDVNVRALRFIKDRIACLSQNWQVAFLNIQYISDDFLVTNFANSFRTLVIFGNPPFVNKGGKELGWKNSFADFVAKSLEHIGPSGILHFILPLSIASSENYIKLRKMLLEYPRELTFSHFDNIPDTLFKSGKPAHEVNPANSQRCSFLTVMPSFQKLIYSTQLHRWSRSERDMFLSKPMHYLDVTHYSFDDQVPRPVSQFILDYLAQCENWKRLGDLLDADGEFKLHLARVARNFIPIRDESNRGNITLIFRTMENFYRALLLLTSDLFFEYWRTVGDGFHLTKTSLYAFPLSPKLLDVLTAEVSTAKYLWSNREVALKTKLNAGKMLISYDFSALKPELIPKISL